MSVNLTLGDTQLIINTCVKHDLLRNQAAYVLATAYWETARNMKPVVEAYWLSENWRKKNLRYYPWHGRGYVQLTWKANYIKAGKELGVDFTKNPDLLLEPKYSAEVLVLGSKDGWFTGKKLSDYITLKKSGFVGARRIINGTDKKNEIAKIAKQYDKLLTASGYGVALEPTQEPVQEIVEEKEVTLPEVPVEAPKETVSFSWSGFLVNVLKALVGSK